MKGRGSIDLHDIFDFISNAADGILAVDREQRIVLWNRAAETLLGFKAREVLGRYCYEVFGGRDESGCLDCHESCSAVVMALRQDPVPTRDLLVRTKAGRAVWVGVSTVLIPSRWRDLCILVHLFRAVSREKELERLVQQLLSSVAKLTLSSGPDPPMSPASFLPSNGLTLREREVLRLLASAVSTELIAEKLCISPATARNHIHNIFDKLGVHSRLEAVTLSLRNGLLAEGGASGTQLAHNEIRSSNLEK